MFKFVFRNHKKLVLILIQNYSTQALNFSKWKPFIRPEQTKINLAKFKTGFAGIFPPPSYNFFSFCCSHFS